MRRSFRDAIVGFSILGGFVALSGAMLWLKGVRLKSNSWEVTAQFEDASGLAERSPITYRGILVGSVGKIEITPNSVQAKLAIDNNNLRLSKPVLAKVITSSLLGGDVQISLISTGKSLSPNSPYPLSENCLKSNVLCNGERIKGEPLTSISTLTKELEQILKKAERENVISSLVNSTEQFDLTQKKLEELIIQLKEEMTLVEPILENLAAASQHISNILASLDNPKTLNDIQETASSTRSIAKKIDRFGTDIQGAIEDKELMNALRNVTIGLGKLFNELYPEQRSSI